MCKSQKQGGQRCDSYYFEEYQKALLTGDNELIRKTEDEYYCTKRGILELVEDENELMLNHYLDKRISHAQTDKLSKRNIDFDELIDEKERINQSKTYQQKQKERDAELKKIMKIEHDYAKSERNLVTLFSPGTKFTYKGHKFISNYSGKPQSQGQGGEGKTDILIIATDEEGNRKVIKISYKQKNADSYENWVSEDRAKEIFKSQWRNVLQRSIDENKENFNSSLSKSTEISGAVNPNSFVMGYAVDIRSRPRKLSTKLSLSDEQKKQIYSGANMSQNKRDSLVGGRVLKDSGVATHILVADNIKTPQEAIDKMVSIDAYIKNNPEDLYLSFKAVNAEKRKKYQVAKRSLAVSTKHQLNNDGIIEPTLIMSNPLGVTSQDARRSLMAALRAKKQSNRPI